MLADDVTRLSGVGPRTVERLRKLNIRAIGDLLFHVPIRYQDRTRVVPIGALRPAQEAVIQGRIEVSQVQFGKRRSLLVYVSDGTGALILRFFHFNQRQREGLETGRTIRCFGEPRVGPRAMEMVHPEYRIIDAEQTIAVEEVLTPIYATTEGLQQGMLRRLTDLALQVLADDPSMTDDIDTLLETHAPSPMPALRAALRYVHRPPPDARQEELANGRDAAQQRLALDELLAHQLSLRRLRATVRSEQAPAIPSTSASRTRLLCDLPFALTGAQQRVLEEIDADIAQSRPMLRLLQGDVGAGKTVVAAALAAAVIDAGHKVAIMAPTELLAEQHRRNMQRWFSPLGIPVVALSGRQKKSERRQALEHLTAAAPCIAVGTHALFQQAVAFSHLGLVVIDEQHRFGVDQRLALRDKGRYEETLPHQLIMTATPIPRTLAMTAYADLDVSVIDELPPNRTPVTTVVIPDTRRPEIVERIAGAIANRRQIYWVCPLIDQSDVLEAQSAIDAADQLREALPEARIGLVHGRMKDAEKDATMRAFAAHEIDLLVATTVIEVGVDVPNASLMVIENAERMGLAQLHQLRGRVGRGSTASDCVLMYHGPLSRMAQARLKVMRETTDGFVIADQDLALRGPGEVLGTRQAGTAGYRIADLSRDADLLPTVRALATRLLKNDSAVVDTVIDRWLGYNKEYASV
ncbi:MAG: ATP-dependent DNA helicase RecG [Gammaproteobacteria bacterium]|nr:ATP-dependent DNA helicase RecG [Gammaproteobacteria bacterium]